LGLSFFGTGFAEIPAPHETAEFLAAIRWCRAVAAAGGAGRHLDAASVRSVRVAAVVRRVRPVLGPPSTAHAILPAARLLRLHQQRRCRGSHADAPATNFRVPAHSSWHIQLSNLAAGMAETLTLLHHKVWVPEFFVMMFLPALCLISWPWLYFAGAFAGHKPVIRGDSSA
jgi:hypothetical protein